MLEFHPVALHHLRSRVLVWSFSMRAAQITPDWPYYTGGAIIFVTLLGYYKCSRVVSMFFSILPYINPNILFQPSSKLRVSHLISPLVSPLYNPLYNPPFKETAHMGPCGFWITSPYQLEPYSSTLHSGRPGSRLLISFPNSSVFHRKYLRRGFWND